MQSSIPQGPARVENSGQQKLAFDKGIFRAHTNPTSHITSQHSAGVGITLAPPSADHLGVTIMALDGPPVVIHCEGLSASTWDPGTIQVGDAIVALDNVWILGEPFEYVKKQLQVGPLNSTVKLRLLRKVGQDERQYNAVLKRHIKTSDRVVPSAQIHQQKKKLRSFCIEDNPVPPVATHAARNRVLVEAGLTLQQEARKHGLKKWSPSMVRPAVKHWWPEV